MVEKWFRYQTHSHTNKFLATVAYKIVTNWNRNLKNSLKVVVFWHTYTNRYHWENTKKRAICKMKDQWRWRHFFVANLVEYFNSKIKMHVFFSLSYVVSTIRSIALFSLPMFSHGIEICIFIAFDLLDPTLLAQILAYVIHILLYLSYCCVS